MNSSYTFGAYLNKDSVVHKIDARVKIILACAFSFAIALVDDWWALLAFCTIIVSLFLLGKVSLVHAARGLAPLLFILIFTLLVHTFTFSVPADQHGNMQDGCIALIGTFGISVSGAFQGMFLATRIALLMLCGSLLTFTTSIDELSWAISSLLNPLSKIRVPVIEISMVIVLALRLVPVMIDKAYMIRKAQISRGARFESGSILDRARSWTGVLVPLVVGLIRYADELADVLDMRGYAGIAPLSSRVYHEMRWSSMLACISMLIIVGIVVFLSFFI